MVPDVGSFLTSDVLVYTHHKINALKNKYWTSFVKPVQIVCETLQFTVKQNFYYGRTEVHSEKRASPYCGQNIEEYVQNHPSLAKVSIQKPSNTLNQRSISFVQYSFSMTKKR